MSWSSRRRTSYLSGVVLFFVVVLGVPLAIWLYEPPSCTDSKQNQGETDVDVGGPCPLADVDVLTPPGIMWARSFTARLPVSSGGVSDGIYNAVAYIENTNPDIGVFYAPYRFKFYDSSNVLVAEREGVTFIMPGSVTPIFEGQVETGHRAIVRTFIEFTEPFVWEYMEDTARALTIGNRIIEEAGNAPRVTARITNTSVVPVKDVEIVAVVFDAAGNAFAASQTAVTHLGANETSQIVFAWSHPFAARVGRVDILPLRAPERSR